MKTTNRWLALILIAAVAPALAQERSTVAVASSLKGAVLVNKGAQFAPAVEGDGLAPGDRVLVPRDGLGEIVFADGCRYTVKPGTMVTVPEKSVCAGGAMMAVNSEPAGTGALGEGGSNAVGYGAFVVAAAASGYVVIHNASSNDHNNRPISP